jgi:carbon-monoxide dehydrogenase small subunit
MLTVSMTVNGNPVTSEIEDQLLLARFLRDTLGLTGTHVGCDTTHCGCCVVHLNGVSVKSCTVLAAQANGAAVTTIEGVARNGELHPVQRAFHECHALQCGFCTPGMIMAAIELIETHPETLTAETVRDEMEGNLCRCTGYHNIVKAILQAAEEMRAPQSARAGGGTREPTTPELTTGEGG